ncbi:MAG: class I SAM-dependent methyltransferase [Chthoniobacterales bacterium]
MAVVDWGFAETPTVIDRGYSYMKESNSYSATWFEFFHVPIGKERTEREVEFVCAMRPLPGFRRVLDVCCGMGRHARALAARGYWVTAVERDDAAIARAIELGGALEYIQADVRDYRPSPSAYDLAIIMSQSFGYFDEATNRDLLRRLADGVRRGGRIVLDLWNPEFFGPQQGERDLETPRGTVREATSLRDGRLYAQLTYPDGAKETFEWQLFSAKEMHSLADSAGLVLAHACTDFNATTEPNPANPRIQVVLERL